MRARAGFSASPHLSHVKLSKISNVSNYVTRRIKLYIGQAQGSNHSITATLSRPQSNKNNLIFVVVYYVAQSRFQLNFF